MNNQITDDITFKDFIQKISELIKYLNNKKIFFLFAILIGSTLGVTYSYLTTPKYVAKLTFALEEKNNSNGIGSIASQFGLSIGGSEGGAFSGDNLLELMKSRYLVEKTLLTNVVFDDKEMLLVNYLLDVTYKNKNDNADKLFRFYKTKREFYTRSEDSLLGLISNNIIRANLVVAKNDKKLNIITVKIVSLDEKFSKIFCEVLVKNVTDFYIETKVSRSKKNVDVLQNRLDSVKNELDKSMYNRAAFSDNNYGLIKQRATVPKIKQEMNVQIQSTMYSELMKNLEFSKLSLMRDEPLIQIIDKPIYPLEIIKFGKLKGIIYGSFISLFLFIVFFVLKFYVKNNF
jgi:hypothetical protein